MLNVILIASYVARKDHVMLVFLIDFLYIIIVINDLMHGSSILDDVVYFSCQVSFHSKYMQLGVVIMSSKKSQ